MIQGSREEHDYKVVSIFANQPQFAPTEDLDEFPTALLEDIKLLDHLRIDALFAPNGNDMYPQGIPLDVSETLEGSTIDQFLP